MVAAVRSRVGVMPQQGVQHRLQLPVLGLVDKEFQFVAICGGHPVTSTRSTPG